jgi:hypothetical protein
MVYSIIKAFEIGVCVIILRGFRLEQNTMAEITNGRIRDGLLSIRIDVLRKEPESGMIARNTVDMNSDMGLLWTEVAFQVGRDTIYGQEVLLHSSDIRYFTQSIEDMIYEQPQEEQEQRIHFPISSPELLITVKQVFHERDPLAENGQMVKKDRGDRSVSARYELLVVIDTGIASGEAGVAGEGPAMYMQPEEKRLLSFICDLRAEAEMALLLDE